MRIVTVLPAALAATVGCAHAASISVASLGGDAEQALVLVQGDLVPGDIDDFRDKTGSLRKAIVAFDSNGGSLSAGIEIGKMIRLKNFITLVSQGERCASACAISWLGGTQRLMGPQARIGFHAAYTVQLGQPAETGVGNAVLGAYLNQIGVPNRAIIYITETPPNSMTWLTLKDAEKHGIDVTLLDPAQPPVPRATTKPAVLPGVTDLQRRAGKFLSGLLAKWSGPSYWHCQLLKSCPQAKAGVVAGHATNRAASPAPASPSRQPPTNIVQDSAQSMALQSMNAGLPARPAIAETAIYGAGR